MKVNPIAIVAGGLAGVLAVGLATKTPPRPDFQRTPWSITASEGVAVTPERPLELPLRYGDFDLTCQVELPPDADLDLIFRKVEHWGDVHLPIFHARFAAVRISSRKDGPGNLSREDLLFEPETGGVRVSPGSPASLDLSCRGTRVTGVVNGVVLPEFSVTDDFGNIALVSRRGVSVVHGLAITPWPSSPSSVAWFLGAGLGLFLGWWLGALGGTKIQIGFALVVFAAGGALGSWCVTDRLLPATAPSWSGVILAAMSLLPVAVCLGIRALHAVPRLLLAVLVGGVGAVVLLELAAREERPRLAAFEDDRLDLVFGPESGTAPYDAVARRLRCQFMVHPLLPERRYDVLLLGSRRMFDLDTTGGAPGKNIVTELPMRMRETLRLPVKETLLCAAVPTDLACAEQQLELFRLAYQDFRPKVVVLGLTGDEDDVHAVLGASPQRVAGLLDERKSSGLVLVDIFRRSSLPTGLSGHGPQTGAELTGTLGRLRSLCEEIDSRLVLAVDRSLSEDLRSAVLSYAGSQGISTVTGFAIDAGNYPLDQLSEAVLREWVR